jgi:3-polyprenyl-4-hydroxybenzoate decarboxylase
MGTLARIAPDRARRRGLPEQKRPFVLSVRETALNKIHICNVCRVADAGAIIPATLDDTAREFAYRVLAHLGPFHPSAFPWKGTGFNDLYAYTYGVSI